MADPLFMSPEHIAIMNDRLAASVEVREICSDLERPISLAYVLADGPDGQTVHWTVSFDETVSFGLEPKDADVTLRGDWTRMVRTSRGAREGEDSDPGIVPEGDLALLAKIQELIGAIHPYGAVPVTFPDV